MSHDPASGRNRQSLFLAGGTETQRRSSVWIASRQGAKDRKVDVLRFIFFAMQSFKTLFFVHVLLLANHKLFVINTLRGLSS